MSNKRETEGPTRDPQDKATSQPTPPTSEPADTRSRQRLAVSIGAGRCRVQARLQPIPDSTSPVEGLALVLSGSEPEIEGWWSPHHWTGDSRASNNSWVSSLGVAVDVDCGSSTPNGKKKPSKVAFSPETLDGLISQEIEIPGSIIHATPHGFRVIFVFDQLVVESDKWKAAAQEAIALVQQFLDSFEGPLTPEGARLAIDEPATIDQKRFFFLPNARVKGLQRSSDVSVLRSRPYPLAELTPAEAPRAATERPRGVKKPVKNSLKKAIEGYKADHPQSWPTQPTTCPACDHNDCFHAQPGSDDHWFCFSSNHEGCGSKTAKGHHGDVLDLDAFNAGRTPKEHIIAEGYLQPRLAKDGPSDTNTLTPIPVPGAHDQADQSKFEVQEAEFSESVVRAIPNGTIYRRAGTLGEIRGRPGKIEFHEVSPEGLRNIVTKHCRFFQKRLVKAGDSFELRDNWQPCSNDRARLIADGFHRSETTPGITRIVSYPVFAGRDFQLLQPGWNRKFETFVDLPRTFDLASPNSHLGIEEARDLLLDLVIDFPFADDASRDNFFGLLLTPLLRPSIDDNIPLHLVDAPLERTGKSKLIEQVLGRTVLGRPTPTIQLGAKEEEIEKRITSMLLAGQSILNADNLGRHLDSASIASLLTTRIWQGRRLGCSQLVQMPNETTLVASGNNVTASKEIAKRIVLIRLDPKVDRPDLRTDFRHQDLAAYLTANRLRGIRTLVSMVETWKREGAMALSQPFGGFEGWTSTVGGVLHHFGFTAWMKNREDWIRRNQPDETDQDTLVQEWARRFPNPVSPSELLPILTEKNILIHVRERGESGKASSLGRLLSGMVDRVFAGFFVRRRPFGTGSRYHLEPIS